MEKKFTWMVVIGLIIVLLDQLTKWRVASTMSLHQSLPVIQNVFHITFVTNTGAGFGLLQNFGWVLIWVSIIVLGYIFYSYDQIPDDRKWYWVFVGLIIGGIIGNLIDRIAAGYVVDFLDFRVWPVFNIADSALFVGAIGLIIESFKK